MEYFSYINPCGFLDKGVTSVEKELGQAVTMAELKVKMKKHLAEVFALRWV
jgi:lipoyl(octanoyl) transferase